MKSALPVSVGLLLVLLVGSLRRSPVWPVVLRWQGTSLGAMVMVMVVASVVGVFSGGTYMADRFGADNKTLGGCIHSWRLGLAMLDTLLDWVFGKGLGRFPANHALATAGTDKRPGDYRLGSDARGQHLVLSAGAHAIGFLKWLPISRRVSQPQTPVTVRCDMRAPGPVSLRTTFGNARNHVPAPPLAAALVGFAVVVLFSSVTDVPRVALLFYFMLLVALTLRGPATPR